MPRDAPPNGASAPAAGSGPRAPRRDALGSSIHDQTDPGALELESEPVTIVLAGGGDAERIGRYVVRGVLGRGGMGVVYEVEAAGVPGRLALKTIETRFLELSDGAAAQRFRHEIKVLERLVHPSVVRLYDAGIARHPLGYELAYYVMEKLDGDTLVPAIKSGTPLPPDEALRVAASLADALDYLSRNNVLHRDIKPGNIFLEESGRVVLVDFGLARSQEFTRLTLAGQIVGTFSYMSPERLAGQVVDVSADVFAVGVVFFQMLTGRHPFGSGTPPELMAAIHRGIDWPESFGRIERAAELRPLISSMLAIDARARPAPGALAERMRAMRGRRTPARPPIAATPDGDVATPQNTLDPVRPPVTVLIEAGGRGKPTPDPAASPAAPSAPWGREIAPTDATPARSPARPAPIAVRTASGGPTWMMFGFASGSLACLAFTIGLLIGNRAGRAPHAAGRDTGSEVGGGASEGNAEATTVADLVANARVANDRGQPAEAIRLAAAALAREPGAPEPHRLLGDAYGMQGQLASAIDHYKKYLGAAPAAADADSVAATIKTYEALLAGQP